MIQQEENKDKFKTDFLGRPMKGPPGSRSLVGTVLAITLISYLVYWVKGNSVRPPVYDTSSTRMIRKTIKDISFRKDDIIRLPGLNDSAQVIADFLNSHKNIQFEFSVHMSPTDTSSYTQSLKESEELAEKNVKMLIRDQCVDFSQLRAKGYGMLLPLSTEEEIEKAKTPAEKEKLEKINRRCELKVLSVK